MPPAPVLFDHPTRLTCRRFLAGVLALAFAALASRAGAESVRANFSFVARETALPVRRDGMFVGESAGALIAGGGIDEQGRPAADVFVLPPGATAWQRSELRHPVAYAAYTSGSAVANGATALFVAGGIGPGGLTPAVQRLRWADGTLEQDDLPALPQPVAMAGAGIFEDQPQHAFYVVGGTGNLAATPDSLPLVRYNLGQGANGRWETLPPLARAGRVLPAVACFYNDVLVFGGFTVADAAGGRRYTPTADVRAYRWKPIDGTTWSGWRKVTPLPEPVAAALVFQTGQVHALVCGGATGAVSGQLPRLLASGGGASALTGASAIYHDVTETWVRGQGLPHPLAAGAAVKRNGHVVVIGTAPQGRPGIYNVENQRTVKSLSGWDYLGLLVFFAIVATSGIYYSRRQKTSSGYALGDRKMPWWMTGISMFATAASSISFMAIPAQAFRTSIMWAVPFLLLIPLYFLEAYVLYPLIRKLEITSTFEYLERRFHPSLRYIASLQAMALQVFGRMNMVLLLPALAIAAVTGLSVTYSVLLMGVVTTIYTVKGGMRAVVLTEVIQGITMVLGMTLIILLAIKGLPHGLRDFITVGRQYHKFDLGIWSLDYTMPIFWILALTPLIVKLGFASDQPTVQRVFATPLKDMRKLAFMFLCFSVFIAFASNFAGISVFAYFHQHPAQLNPTMTNDQIIPLYIVERLPAGIAGLIIASLFAAAMSALAGSMNSVAILFTEDFYAKFKKPVADRERLIVMRVASLVAGLIATGCALYMGTLDQRSLFQTWNELLALLGGGFLGVYILGTYTHRANAIGAFTGAIVSIGVAVWLKNFTSVHWYAYTPFAVFSCVGVGYVVSLCTPRPKHSLAGLTVFDMKAKPAAMAQEVAR